MQKSSSVSDKILKLQKKLCTFEEGSRNYKKYQKILAKHNMKQRVTSNIKTIEVIKELDK